MSQPTHRGIILLGMPRSGTTLLRRLLDGHPNIAAPGETFLLRATARFLETERIADGIDYGVLGGLGAAGYAEEEVLGRLRHLAFGFLDEIAAGEGKPRWAAKTAVDSFYLDRIDRIYGAHASFVCLVRHGPYRALCGGGDECRHQRSDLEVRNHRHPQRDVPGPFPTLALGLLGLVS